MTECAGCGQPGVVLCRPCRFALVARSGVDAPAGVLVAAPFSGRVRHVLLGFKYRNRRAVAGHLAGLVVNRVVASGARPDVVTWAPTTRRRRHDRGFDQAELIARHVARQLGLPCRRLLDHVASDGPQTGRGRLERQRRMSGDPLRASPRVPAGHVLVVDDVVTTGATLQAAADALRAAGATAVTMAAVAATPGLGRAHERAA